MISSESSDTSESSSRDTFPDLKETLDYGGSSLKRMNKLDNDSKLWKTGEVSKR